MYDYIYAASQLTFVTDTSLLIDASSYLAVCSRHRYHDVTRVNGQLWNYILGLYQQCSCLFMTSVVLTLWVFTWSQDLCTFAYSFTLETLSPEKQGLLAATVRAVLLKPTPWVVGAWLRAAPEVRSNLEAASIVPNDIDEYMARAGALFISSRLGAFSVSSNAHGPKTLFFVKRPLENTNPSYVLYLNMIRTGFGLPLDQVKAFAPEHVQTQKPRNATDPIFPDEITEEVAGAIQPRIAAFGAHAAPLG